MEMCIKLANEIRRNIKQRYLFARKESNNFICMIDNKEAVISKDKCSTDFIITGIDSKNNQVKIVNPVKGKALMYMTQKGNVYMSPDVVSDIKLTNSKLTVKTKSNIFEFGIRNEVIV